MESTIKTFHINRSRALVKLLKGYGWIESKPSDIADFGMWCAYDVKPRVARCQLFDYPVTRFLDDKLSMYQLLVEHGEAHCTPAVFSELSSYLHYINTHNEEVFCFLKTTLGAGGNEVFVFNDIKALIRKIVQIKQSTGAAMIIQQGIQDVALIRSRKFKIRTYVVVTKDWTCHVYQDSLVVVHDQLYCPDSTDLSVQISPNSGETASLLRDEPNLIGVDRKINRIVAKTIRCLHQKSAQLENNGRYHLFGFDFICDAQLKTYLIEVNAFPNIERQDFVGNQLSQRMLNDLKKMVIDTEGAKPERKTGAFIKLS